MTLKQNSSQLLSLFKEEGFPKKFFITFLIISFIVAFIVGGLVLGGSQK